MPLHIVYDIVVLLSTVAKRVDFDLCLLYNSISSTIQGVQNASAYIGICVNFGWV